MLCGPTWACGFPNVEFSNTLVLFILLMCSSYKCSAEDMAEDLEGLRLAWTPLRGRQPGARSGYMFGNYCHQSGHMASVGAPSLETTSPHVASVTDSHVRNVKMEMYVNVKITGLVLPTRKLKKISAHLMIYDFIYTTEMTSLVTLTTKTNEHSMVL